MVYTNYDIDAISAGAIASWLVEKNTVTVSIYASNLSELIKAFSVDSKTGKVRDESTLFSEYSENDKINHPIIDVLIGFKITESELDMISNLFSIATKNAANHKLYIIANGVESYNTYHNLTNYGKIMDHQYKKHNVYVYSSKIKSLSSLTHIAFYKQHSYRRVPTAIKYIDTVVMNNSPSYRAKCFVLGLKSLDRSILNTLWKYLIMDENDHKYYKSFRINTLHYIETLGEGIERKNK